MNKTTGLSPRLEKISKLFLLCQKNITLYPKIHPRVDQSIQELQSEISNYHQETGQILAFETFTSDNEPSKAIAQATTEIIRELQPIQECTNLC